MKNIAIIVAGGRGRRMGRDKQFIPLAGKPMLFWTVSAFQESKLIDGIIIVTSRKNMLRAEKLPFSKIIKVIEGGKERQDSVINGLKQLPPETQMVAIHDGARPAVTAEIINRSITEAKRCGAAIAGVPVKDTIKMTNNKYQITKGEAIILKTLDRNKLWMAQTPQTFKADLIIRAYKAYGREKFTDDAAVVEKTGKAVLIIAGSYDNIKVTTPEDIMLMTAILRGRRK